MNNARRILVVSVWALGLPAGIAEAQPAAGEPKATSTRPVGERKPKAPEKALEALSFKNAAIEQIAKYLSEKKKKPVIPHESIMKKKITIVNAEKVPLAEALRILEESLRDSGIIMEEHLDLIKLKPLSEAKQSLLPVLSADEDLADVKDRSKIVNKIFLIRHYDVLQLKDIILPMLQSFGHITADPYTRKLMVVDTVANLARIERLIKSVDIPLADRTITKIIEVQRGDATEIVSILRHLISGVLGKKVAKVAAAPAGAVRPDRAAMAAMAARGGRPPSAKAKKPSVGASATFVQPSKATVVLVPWVTRNWIIAVAPAEIMKRIEEWVKKFDVAGRADKVFDMIKVEHADVEEVARQITQTIESMPDAALSQNIRVVPFVHSRTLVVFGSEQGRAIVQELLKKLDIEASEYQMSKEILLQYEDAEAVKTKLDELFSRRQLSYESYYGSRSYRYERGATKVTVVADTRRNTVTVITDKTTLGRIEELIAEWDKPLEIEDVAPKVYTLQHTDPIQVRDLLLEMFSKKARSFDWRTIFYGRPSTEITPVGRLFGQFSFQAMPNSNKLIVTSKNPHNYKIIDRLIKELDKPQTAGLPRVVELKHANAEDLCEQLNALLSEAGTIAQILRSQRGLSPRPTTGNGSNPKDSSGQTQDQSKLEPMKFWWEKADRRTDEMPTSNLIGKIRFVPVYRRNALMVLAPQAYVAPLEELIQELDRPGRQVLIHAVIAEVQHDDQTTLGVRFAADPSLLSDPRLLDTAIRATGGLGEGRASVFQFNELFGGTFAIGADTFGRTILQANLSAPALLQLLMRQFNLKVLFEPKLYTADNQESEFFDGQDVPFQTRSQSSPEGATVTQDIDYREVGTRLCIRPHITKEGRVDLMINLEVSRIVPGETAFGNFIFDRRETTTNVIVGDAQTVMLSGIVREEIFDEVRKLPVLGDLPLIGHLFRSVDKSKRNRELVAFITPHVLMSPEEQNPELEKYKKTLERLKRSISPADPAETEIGAVLGKESGK